MHLVGFIIRNCFDFITLEYVSYRSKRSLSVHLFFQKCGQVFGVEYLEQNVEDAKINAAKNEITNCEFIAGRVEDVLPTLTEKITGKTVVPILDPPRIGLSM